MTHPKGSITYLPQPRFAFPRAYIKVLDIFTNNDNPASYTDGLIVLSSISVPTFREYIKIKDNVLPFSNTGFTLDYLIEYWYYQYHPTDPETPYGGIVKFMYFDNLKQTGLQISTDSPNTHLYVQLAKPPGTYWLPPELGD